MKNSSFNVLAIAATLALVTTSAQAAGNATSGKTYYMTCGACHGVNGKGMQALNSPALTGLSDWYIIRQLQNYKSGIRGANPRDIYGMQMAPMAQILPNDQAIEDVTAYIMTLGR